MRSNKVKVKDLIVISKLRQIEIFRKFGTLKIFLATA